GGGRSAQDVLDKNLADWCRDRGADDIVASIWPHGVPVARVTPGVEADSLEQHAARGFFESVSHPITGTQLHIGYPVGLERGPRRMHRSPAPTLGEHNEAVFCGLLGMTGDELRQLAAEALIRTPLLGPPRTRCLTGEAGWTGPGDYGSHMELTEALYTTRAMRRITDQPIAQDVQARILDAAIRVPSAGNTQRWRFLVVDDPDVKAQLGPI